MKPTIVKKSVSRILLAFTLVFASFSDSMAAWPGLLDKREGGEVSGIFYIVMTLVIIIGIIIAIVTTRETNPDVNK